EPCERGRHVGLRLDVWQRMAESPGLFGLPPEAGAATGPFELREVPDRVKGRLDQKQRSSLCPDCREYRCGGAQPDPREPPGRLRAPASRFPEGPFGCDGHTLDVGVRLAAAVTVAGPVQHQPGAAGQCETARERMADGE